jgi:hypothetical protein
MYNDNLTPQAKAELWAAERTLKQDHMTEETIFSGCVCFVLAIML